ncbi:MAG TPA: hypothetical protein VIL29_09200 [Pseudothermotoga sp.]|uniref:hypothetical protein n=1 Tax=Thermotoga profunda TaxID=1508420 RepID=UPI000596E7E2|nr:hypothetical protein [Thermotoga profunda]
MNCLELLYSPKKIMKVAGYWTLLIPFILVNTLWFSLSDKIRYVLLNTNYFSYYIEFNLIVFIYIAILCGVVALLERNFKKIFSLPLFFIPYFFVPIYLRILEILDLPPIFSISIGFVHSLLFSFNCYRLSVHIIRTVVCILVILVVRRWFSVTLL